MCPSRFEIGSEESSELPDFFEHCESISEVWKTSDKELVMTNHELAQSNQRLQHKLNRLSGALLASEQENCKLRDQCVRLQNHLDYLNSQLSGIKGDLSHKIPALRLMASHLYECANSLEQSQLCIEDAMKGSSQEGAHTFHQPIAVPSCGKASELSDEGSHSPTMSSISERSEVNSPRVYSQIGAMVYVREGKTLIYYTTVAYDKGDLIGHGLAYFSLLPPILVAVLVALSLSAESRRRRIICSSMTMAVFFNEAINLVLKRLLKCPRPGSFPVVGIKNGDYAMPSSHAQLMGCLLALILLLARSRSVGKHYYPILFILKLTTFVSTVLVCISRVYLGYHLVEQVLVGAAIGFAFGSLWATVHKLL